MPPYLIAIIAIIGFILFVLFIKWITSSANTEGSYFNRVHNRIEAYNEEQKRVAGKEAEEYVSYTLKEIARIYNGRLFNNYCIEDEYGNSIEIDHLFICKGGIFAIETKFWSGKLSGKTFDNKVTFIKSYDHTSSFHSNPIIQNQNHILFLKRLIKRKTPKIENMVILIGTDYSEFKHESIFDLETAKNKIIQMIRNSDKSNDYVMRYYEVFKEIKNLYGISSEEHKRRIEQKNKS